jgi:FAD/FMN-containing dehydrogenase
VPIKLISGSDWSTYAATYNTRLEYTPAVIALPTTNQNVQDAVTCGVQFGATMQAKGGGHSYASFSTGGQNGDLMIDMQQFQTVSVDANGIATVGAGLRCVTLPLLLRHLTRPGSAT